MTTKKLKPVLILDKHHGVYFGYLKRELSGGATVELINARHCFYWPIAQQGHKGVFGLATVGPCDGAKVGPRVDMKIRDVVKIVDCKKEAVDRWESAVW